MTDQELIRALRCCVSSQRLEAHMKPILFNTEMVRAILDDRKSVTRRVVKPGHLRVLDSQYHKEHPEVPDKTLLEKLCLPPYQPGDTLWVRETWNGDWCDHYIYKADGGSAKAAGYAAEPKWRPSIHMPREAARLFLRVKEVSVEKLREISALSAMDEGVTDWNDFVRLWNTTIKSADLPLYGWDANPWVWVIEFERIGKDEALGGGGD
uniref:ASCH domain protein n=1 Tax=Myoviridae sp. ctEtC12 TaxID=2825062 RepID=A0A8S5V346_9CAUD|nr:MAG TPA: ASCH domain protein [Myoviridae sp. ctEtC12]